MSVSFLPASAKECGYCGHEFKETPEEKKSKRIAELKELSRNDILDQDLKDKVLLCKAKVISPFWVLHNMKDIEEARIFCTLMGYKKGFEYANKNRFKVFQ